jgi:4-amino-4-deoxy-L-arabinose transferase-like glycosyltransferase
MRITGGRYGFQRDELATLDDARHLAWGYVAYPPVTPLFGRLSLLLFGTSLAGFRFFAALAQAIALVLTGLMARELGGQRWARS